MYRHGINSSNVLTNLMKMFVVYMTTFCFAVLLSKTGQFTRYLGHQIFKKSSFFQFCTTRWLCWHCRSTTERGSKTPGSENSGCTSSKTGVQHQRNLMPFVTGRRFQDPSSPSPPAQKDRPRPWKRNGRPGGKSGSEGSHQILENTF